MMASPEDKTVKSDSDEDKIDTTTLVEKDSHTIMNELKNVLSRCYEIGGRLHLSDDKLEAIKKKNSSNVAAAMKEVIVEWLKKNYDSHEPPTWKALVDAVKHPTGGNNTAEAERIASRHRAGPQSKVGKKPENARETFHSSSGIYSEASTMINKMNTATIKGDFANLVSKVLEKLKSKEIDNDTLYTYIIHMFDLRDHSISKTAGIVEIFESIRINRLWNYYNYHKLEVIISHFGSDDAQLNMWMEKYKVSLAGYLATTQIVKYIDECKDDDAELAETDDRIARFDKQYYKKLSMKLNERVTEKSLEYIDQLWRSIAGICLLPSLSYLIHKIYIGSLIVVLLIPTKSAMQIRKSSHTLASLFQQRDVISVMIEDEIIYQEGATTMASDEEARKIIEYCSKKVQLLTSHSIDDLVAKCKEERDKLDQIHKRKHLIINDPIHGTIKLNSLEKAIIDTPEFYRLRDIKQLGPLFHVYPGATHTRFSHSIGVCYIAGELMGHLKDEIKEVNGNKDKSGNIILKLEHKMCARLAALCHDLGCGPFSHVFKKVSKKVIPEDRFLTHQELSRLIFKKILLDYPVVLALFRDYGLMKQHVKIIESMIIGKPIEEDLKISFETLHEEKLNLNFLYEIVNNLDNGMDVDKWDYIARDCYYLGLSNEFIWRRSMELSRIVKVKQKEGSEHELHIGFRDKEVNNMYGMFRTRSVLHQKAYQHSIGKLIDRMIEDILILVQDVEIIIINIEDRKPTRISLKKALERVFTVSEPADLTGYLALSDGILHHIMHAVPVETVTSNEQTETQTKDDSLIQMRKAQELIKRVQCREIYEIIDEYYVNENENWNLKDLEEEDFIDCIEFTEEQESLDINQVSTDLKFASEESIDPVKNIYFFEEKILVDDFVEGKKLSDGETTLQKRVSRLISIPRVFKEKKVLIYSKKKGVDKDAIKRKFSCGYSS